MELIVALNRPDNNSGIVLELGDLVNYYKVGIQTPDKDFLIEFLTANGKEIFLDGKYWDTPDTIKQAVEYANKRNIYMITVHPDCIEPAMSIKGTTKILSVVTLTTNPERFIQTRSNIWMANECGAYGVVAPFIESELIKTSYPKLKMVTPGIRISDNNNDHKFVTTPAKARELNIDYIVVGRPITYSVDPKEAALRYLQ
jgi:orotidine-5'-phosphate decarboxylase